MSSLKRDALEQYKKVYEAYQKGLVTEGEKIRVENDVLRVDRVHASELREIEEKIRKSLRIRA